MTGIAAGIAIGTGTGIVIGAGTGTGTGTAGNMIVTGNPTVLVYLTFTRSLLDPRPQHLFHSPRSIPTAVTGTGAETGTGTVATMTGTGTGTWTGTGTGIGIVSVLNVMGPDHH